VFDLAPHSLSPYHSALKFVERLREEKGREECNSPLGPAAFPVLFFTAQVAVMLARFFSFSFLSWQQKKNHPTKTFWRGRTVSQVVF